MKAIYAAYAEWTRNYHYPDGPMVSYLDAFKGGIEYARRTPPPATKELAEEFDREFKSCAFEDDEIPYETFVDIPMVRRFIAEWPGPAKEES